MFVSLKISRRSPIISRNKPELFVFHLGGGTLSKRKSSFLDCLLQKLISTVHAAMDGQCVHSGDAFPLEFRVVLVSRFGKSQT